MDCLKILTIGEDFSYERIRCTAGRHFPRRWGRQSTIRLLAVELIVLRDQHDEREDQDGDAGFEVHDAATSAPLLMSQKS